MSRRWLLIAFLVISLAMLLAEPSHAGIIFGRKKEKIEPQSRVPALITTLKSDKDADHRLRAAEELRNYDAQVFPDIITALVAALQTDAKSGVRIEAAQSLGKIRPVNQAAGEALERAVTGDPAMRVRLQARSTLMQYHWAGYKNGKTTDVPPLGTLKDNSKGNENLPPAIRTTPANTTPRFPTSKEPPLAPVDPIPIPELLPVPAPTAPLIESKPMPMPSTPAPLPTGPVTSRPAPMPSPSQDPGPDLP
jgi:hypothetical protein